MVSRQFVPVRSFRLERSRLRAYELAQEVQRGRPSEPLVESRTHCNAQLSSPPLSGAIAYVKSGAQMANDDCLASDFIAMLPLNFWLEEGTNCCLDALNSDSAEVAELSLSVSQHPEPRTTALIHPLRTPTHLNTSDHSTHSHNAFHSCSPRCVRCPPSDANRCTRPATSAVTSRSPRVQLLTRQYSMPNFPGLHRKNNVPAWQRLHQNHDGLRQWQKVGSHI